MNEKKRLKRREAGKCVLIKKGGEGEERKIKGRKSKKRTRLNFFEKSQIYVHRLCAVGSERTAFVEAWAGGKPQPHA